MNMLCSSPPAHHSLAGLKCARHTLPTTQLGKATQHGAFLITEHWTAQVISALEPSALQRAAYQYPWACGQLGTAFPKDSTVQCQAARERVELTI